MVFSGSETASINGAEFAVKERDSFVIPSWTSLEIKARSELVLFGYFYRAAQEKLGLLRDV